MGKHTIRQKPPRDKSQREDHKCPNCGEDGPHFVSPSLGEKGFFTCKRKVNDGKAHDKKGS